MYDHNVESVPGSFVSFEAFSCSANNFSIQQRLNRHRLPTSAPLVLPNLERSTLYRDGSAQVIYRASSGWVAKNARWGRTDCAAENRYLQKSLDYVGLIAVSSFSFRIQKEPKLDWVYDRWQAVRQDGWGLLAVSMNSPDSPSREFAITLTDAVDLQNLINREPLCVPLDRWQQPVGFSTPRAGTWSVQRV